MVEDSKGAISSRTYNILVLPQIRLNPLEISYPRSGEIVRDRVVITGNNGGNRDIDSVSISIDNGYWLETQDMSLSGDWSSWKYTLHVKKLSLGEHDITVMGQVGKRSTPVASIRIIVEEEEDRRVETPPPSEYDDDEPSTPDTDEVDARTFLEDNFYVIIPSGAIFFLFLVVIILIRRRRAHRREWERLIREALAGA